jgi:hypothetical protein
MIKSRVSRQSMKHFDIPKLMVPPQTKPLSDEIIQLSVSNPLVSRWPMKRFNVPKSMVPPQAKALSGEIHQLTVSVLADPRWCKQYSNVPKLMVTLQSIVRRDTSTIDTSFVEILDHCHVQS